MATEVLHPQDVLGDRLRVPHASYQRRRHVPANLNANRRSGGGATQRKTSPKPEKKRINAEESGGAKRAVQGKKDDGVVAGQVILLKRGESLDSLTAKIKSSGNPKSKYPPKQKHVVESTAISAQSGSESLVAKPIFSSPPPRLDSYAGSAFSLSPSPQSLPLPSFFSKKQQNGSRLVDDSATRDLRRLLRLD